MEFVKQLSVTGDLQPDLVSIKSVDINDWTNKKSKKICVDYMTAERNRHPCELICSGNSSILANGHFQNKNHLPTDEGQKK